MDAVVFSDTKDGLTVVAYPGDNKILIAMSLADDAIDKAEKNLAGFAIWRTLFGRQEAVLTNRIGFTQGAQGDTDGHWIPSDQAPFQKFRWIDVPPDGFDKPITYRVRALYFTGEGHATKDGPEVTLDVRPVRNRHTHFKAAFTRGYIASQAYADKFDNAPIRPDGAKTIDFDTTPFKERYTWLGADAYIALTDFIADCEADKSAQVDVFAYDLDEPDVIAAICRMGKEGRLRAILDNADLHSKPSKSKVTGAMGTLPIELDAAKAIKAACGEANVKQGHFDRYQHNKVFIKRDAGGKGQSVIFGSMNFSIRGIFVQANNVMVVDDPATADMFARAFDVAFSDNVAASPFRQNPISQGYMVCAAEDSDALPKFKLALSPHTSFTMSLGPMADRIRAATSSVLYAVMAPTGGGPVLASLRTMAAQPTVFSYGTVETDHGLAVQDPKGAMGDVTQFAALVKNVPANFKKEFDGGMGMHIHDKFVIVDFNGDNPTVFSGSSNLASGGEMQNGDSLAMIEDASIANMFAIEALALFDHFHFRAKAKNDTNKGPLLLWAPGDPTKPNPWWVPSYDQTSIKMRDRLLFAKIPMPDGMKSVKQVDWASVDAAQPAATGKGTKGKPSKGAPTSDDAAEPADPPPAKPRRAPVKKTKTAATKTIATKKVSTKKATAKKATAKTTRKAPAKTGATKKSATKKSPTKTRAAPAKTRAAPAKARKAATKTVTRKTTKKAAKKTTAKKAPARKTKHKP